MYLQFFDGNIALCKINQVAQLLFGEFIPAFRNSVTIIIYLNGVHIVMI
ncbi:hypothetical protein M079_2248 [Bacteroides fragilis str. 3996 N(B) 6]|nr:hypothetical protein M079_2248 [Bacteroides fragilis str. 3996 N(B) 6]